MNFLHDFLRDAGKTVVIPILVVALAALIVEPFSYSAAWGISNLGTIAVLAANLAWIFLWRR